MSIFSQKIYRFSCGFIKIFSLVLSILLFFFGFVSTCYSLDMDSQLVLTRWDNPLWNLASTILVLSAGALVILFLEKLKARFSKLPDPLNILTVIVLLWILTTGAVLILFSKTVPAADAMSVYDAAEALARGETGVIRPVDSYLSYYPQQVGLMAFFELLHRIWNLFPVHVPAYHFIKCLYVFLAWMIVLFQKGIVRLLWNDRRAEYTYLLLAGANLPFLMYTSFVYGEIPSFAAASAGLYFLMRLLTQKLPNPRSRRLTVFGALFFLPLSVMLRKNNLILIIAVLIVVLLQGVKERKKELILFALICGLCGFCILPLVQKYYELRAGNTLNSSVPAISYLAMGMQESSRADGWYNGFNFNTYRDTGMDIDATTQISLQAIQARLTYFKENPEYAARFYLNKFLSQWADGTYASRQATLATFGGRQPFFESLYSGEYSLLFIEYSNIYQNVLYLGVLLFCISVCSKSDDSKLPVYLGLIGVVGGFLFHVFWEANSRYIFLYSLLLMPYCARGLSLLHRRLSNISSRT